MKSYSRQQWEQALAERKTARPRSDGEHENQVAFFNLLRLNEGKFPFLKWIYAVPNAALRGKRERTRILDEGLKAGVSDVCVPIVRSGHAGMYIEFKYGKNKLTPAQIEFLSFVSGQGYRTAVVYSWIEAQAVVEQYLGIKLEKK